MDPLAQLAAVQQRPEFLSAIALVKKYHLAEASESLGKLMHEASAASPAACAGFAFV